MGSAGTGFFLVLAALLAMGSAGTGFFRTLAAFTALALRFLAADSSAFFLHGGVGVQLEHGADVLQGVGFHHRTLHLPVGSSQHLPDGLALEEGGQVSVGHLGLGQVPAVLDRAGLAPGSVETIKLLESSLGPDAKSADVTTGSELQEVKVVHGDGVDSGDVPEGLGQSLVLVINDKRSPLHDGPPVPQLTLAGPHALGGVHLSNISPGLVAPEEHDSLLGLLEGLDLV